MNDPTATVVVNVSLPVVSLDDLTTNDTTPALTGAIDDPTALQTIHFQHSQTVHTPLP